MNGLRRRIGGYCTRCQHTHLVQSRKCVRCRCDSLPRPVEVAR